MPWEPDPLYRQITDEQLFDPLPPEPAMTMLPEPEDLTDTDRFVERTDNSLRPDDLQLEQPPQDPNWRPDADR